MHRLSHHITRHFKSSAKLGRIAIVLFVILALFPAIAGIIYTLVASQEVKDYGLLLAVAMGVRIFPVAVIAGLGIVSGKLLGSRHPKTTIPLYATSLLASASGIVYMTVWLVAGFAPEI